ncbi:hypothetical protein GTQ40_09125 [Flavobacteriaceae bacterium R38]|nr:hypothetical protein [Flavobacteriaceae bacterium R38]
MKTIKTLILAILISGTTFSQTETKQSLEINTLSGYEFNYFKSPDQVLQNGILFNQDSLISSSSYQDINADYDVNHHWKENRLRFSITPGARIFYENPDDSYWTVNATVKYDRELNKKVDFLAGILFKRVAREGLDGAQDVLINPLGYTNIGVNTGIGFRPWKKNKSTIEAFYNNRNFDAFGIRDLQFDEYGVRFKTTQRFKVNKLKHAYGLTGYIKKRLYDTFNASDVVPDGERDWDYIRLTPFYELPVNKNLKLTSSFLYYVRIDNLEDRSGFNQYGPKIAFTFDDDQTKIRSSFSYVMRDYTFFEARDNNGLIGENIQYNYADFSLKATRKIRKSMYLTADIYSRIRTTNFTDIEARSFRSYRNQYAGVGLMWDF